MRPLSRWRSGFGCWAWSDSIRTTCQLGNITARLVGDETLSCNVIAAEGVTLDMTAATVRTRCAWCGATAVCRCAVDFASAFDWKTDELDAALREPHEEAEDARREALRSHAEYPGER